MTIPLNADPVVPPLGPALRPPDGPVSPGAASWNSQRASRMPHRRYLAAGRRVPVADFERTWPGRRLEAAPLWVPVDLRDGNQALSVPMDTERKARFFSLLIGMGFKEIEVGYPAASGLDFDFVRSLVQERRPPDDLRVVLFTASRPDLVARTFEAAVGLPRAVLHLCCPTAPTWRDVVLGCSRAELLELVRASAEDVARRAAAHPDMRLQFSPEAFNLTEPDFALEVCNLVIELWDPSPDRPVTINLPTTVEATTPDVFADQVEHMHTNLVRRDSVILSVHPHNDRGTGVASAELALMAGAQRVEGCLFGNGERTGNVDLVTIALNLLSQGVDPMLDLSDLSGIRNVVEDCNRLRVPERHPYAGDLVYTAFSGTHQDGISKGFARMAQTAEVRGVQPQDLDWNIPYLPLDPADVGRGYEAVIRVNSQSGKSGVAHVLWETYGLDLPRPMRVELAIKVQEAVEQDGGEVTSAQLWEAFRSTFLEPRGRVTVDRLDTAVEGQDVVVDAVVAVDGLVRPVLVRACDGGEAAVRAMTAAGVPTTLLEQRSHGVERPQGRQRAVYIEVEVAGHASWGAGISDDDAAAAAGAVVAAVNRATDRAVGSSSLIELSRQGSPVA